MFLVHKRAGAREQGFTLIELLVVILIIGVLAAIAIPVFLNQRKRAADAAVKSEVKRFALAAETWSMDYPTTQAFQALNPGPFDGMASMAPDRIKIKIRGSAEGYCIAGFKNNGATAVIGKEVWYDSLEGGLSGPKPQPSTGACATSAIGWSYMN